MQNKAKYYIYLLMFFFIVGKTYSQSAPYIVDTITVNSSKVLIYSNQTWSYIHDLYSDSGIVQLDTNRLFTANWTSNQIFAYLGETQNNDRFEIELIDSSQYFMFPFCGKLYRGFGRGHDGLDIGLKKGDTIRTAFDGKVRYATYNRGGYGNLVIVRHYNGLETYYAHLSKLLVVPNQLIKAGAVVGLGGSTGHSFAPHLHFEVRYRDKPLDPLRFIDFDQKQIIEGCRLIVNNNKREPRPLSKNTFHSVKKGDSLRKIAKIYGVTVKFICGLNNISPKTKLKRGTKLRVS